jgi:hypothetical protein
MGISLLGAAGVDELSARLRLEIEIEPAANFSRACVTQDRTPPTESVISVTRFGGESRAFVAALVVPDPVRASSSQDETQQTSARADSHDSVENLERG